MLSTPADLTLMNQTPSEQILCATEGLRSQLLQHHIYNSISERESLRIFMQHHVFAVLDFMWLLKRLQKDLCCIDVPWLPRKNADLARFVNEIVLGEETDEDGQGGYCSHFELYLQSMEDVSISGDQIREFVRLISSDIPVSTALESVGVPESVRRFVEFNYAVATEGTTAEVAAVFCFGREDIIPDMFQRLLSSFELAGMKVPRLAYYIRRHIELDGDHHGPLTRKMVNLLCDTPAATLAATRSAERAISLRLQLWDGVLAELTARS